MSETIPASALKDTGGADANPREPKRARVDAQDAQEDSDSSP